jgi:hypothetical protein
MGLLKKYEGARVAESFQERVRIFKINGSNGKSVKGCVKVNMQCEKMYFWKIQGVFEMHAEILITSYWLHVEHLFFELQFFLNWF